MFLLYSLVIVHRKSEDIVNLLRETDYNALMPNTLNTSLPEMDK